MKVRTAGAWILHHANKLKQFEGHEFEEIEIAGKTGRLLSGLVASDEPSTLSGEKVLAIARVAGVNKSELPTLLDHLQKEQLIDRAKSGEVVALGVTSAAVLTHTANIFAQLAPTQSQIAAIKLSESISAAPVSEKAIKQLIGDTHKLSKVQINDLIQQSEEIGFIDSEVVDDDKLLFNGNLFKSGAVKKAQKVITTLTVKEMAALTNIDSEIAKSGVIPFDNAERIAGRNLLEKLQSIGMYEFSKVSNNVETKLFITKPDAFSKFGNPFEDDALDLAKAFVASLSYGMHYSASGRGRIDMLYALLRKLINGGTVGPATAIGQDYKYLEIKRVVEIFRDGSGFSMKLLKKEVGELAMQVMKQGDVAETSVLSSTSNISKFEGPEQTRNATRKKRQLKQSDTEVANLLRTFRS